MSMIVNVERISGYIQKKITKIRLNHFDYET